MAAKRILTPFQKEIFEIIIQDSFFKESFYFSGGTALAEFYLKHRFSKDLDFFTPKDFSFEEIHKRLDPKFKKLGIDSFEHRVQAGAKLFFLRRPKQEVVTLDFNYFPFKRLEKGKRFQSFEIDSFFDLAVNKLDTILTRPHARDFIDFYFIFKEKEYDWPTLLTGLKKKFLWQVDLLFLTSRLIMIENLHDYPKMIKRLTRKNLIRFFEKEAKKFKKEILQSNDTS